MENVVGQAVTGNDLFGRDSELRELWSKVNQGQHIHMLAPRRVGKTSLMLEMRSEPQKNWHVVYINVEGAENPSDWVASLVAELAAEPTYRTWIEALPFAKARSNIGKMLKEAEVNIHFLRVELSSAMGNEWPDAMEGCYARLTSSPETNSRLLIICDELPVMLSRMLRQERGREQVELFLSKLRSWRQSPLLRGTVLMLLGGSVGLDGVLRRHGLSATINDLVPFRVDAWNRQTAVEFLQQLSQDLQFRIPENQVDVMLNLLKEPVPYHVQLFFKELFDSVGGQASAITTERVEECFETRLTGPGGPYLNHYVERLKLSLDADSFQAAEVILNRASNREGVSIKDIEAIAKEKSGLYRSVLDELEHDGYINRIGDRIEFRSALLRTWWQKNSNGAVS